MLIIIFLFLMLSLIGLVEKKRHISAIKKIRLIIQVNGTRGKSTLVKMLVSLFNETGFRVIGKITGETPQYFSTTNGWQITKRFGPARIKEMLTFGRLIRNIKPEVLIVENMSLEAEYQHVFENELLHSDVCIVTNIRNDHQEIMGKNLTEVAATISHSLPKHGYLILPENFLIDISTDNRQIEYIPDTTENPYAFHYAVLEKISANYKFSQQILDHTLACWKQKLNPDNFKKIIRFNGKEKQFVDLFSCNDVESTRRMIHYMETTGEIKSNFAIILTCREDRPLRTLSFLNWLMDLKNWNELTVCGNLPRLTMQQILKNSSHNGKLLLIRKIVPEKLLTNIFEKNELVIGMGNYVRSGEKILQYLEGISHDN